MRITDRLLFHSKCTGPAACLTHSDISLSMYYKSMLNKRWITLPVVNRVLLPQKRLFERFGRILSSPIIFPNNRRTREESLFWKVSIAGAIFPQKIALLWFQTLQQKRSKDSRFSSYLPIENPSKRPGASPRRKLKCHSLLNWMSLNNNRLQSLL